VLAQATSEDLFGDGVQVLPTVRQGEGLICEAYTRVLTRCGSVHNDSTKLCCANCESFICPMHAVLSDQHCWRLPGRDCVESAYYVNSLIPESFTLTKQRSSRLAQGDMTVADVSCSSCNCPLGWKVHYRLPMLLWSSVFMPPSPTLRILSAIAPSLKSVHHSSFLIVTRGIAIKLEDLDWS